MQILSYTPGQKVTIFLETFNSDGYRTDSLTTPSVNRIFLPDLSLSIGFPLDMDQVDEGLYTFSFTLPKGAIAVGSYLIDVSYIHPTTEILLNQTYQIICNAPFGVYSITTT